MSTNGDIVNPQPYGKLTAITKSDSTVYDPPLDGLWVGGTGNVAVVDMAGNTVTITGVAAGALLPFRVKQVMSTNTTATNMVGVQW